MGAGTVQSDRGWMRLLAVLADAPSTRSGRASIRMVGSMLSLSVATMTGALACAHLFEGRWWYLPAVLVSAVVAVGRFVLGLRWRDAANRLLARERAAAAHGELTWSSDGVREEQSSFAAQIERAAITLVTTAGVSQLGAAVHLYQARLAVLLASGLVALVSALLAVLIVAWDVASLRVESDPWALAAERPTNEGVIHCTLYASERLDFGELSVELLQLNVLVSLYLRVSDVQGLSDGVVRFSLRCAAPASVDWARWGHSSLVLRLGVGANKRLFSMNGVLDDLRPRFVPA